MALPYPPIDPNNRIPNNPFYAPEQYYLSGEFGPIVIGSGLQIDYSTGTLSAIGGGTPGVTSISAGVGVSVTASTGAVTVNNTGVIHIAAGAGIGVIRSGGNYTIINTAPAIGTSGTVTSITAGPGLAGGTITNSGTISLATSGVGPGTYTNPTITVDAYGRITFASPGSGGSGGGFPVLATLPLRSNNLLPSTISIDLATTAAAGAVQLNDSVTSTVTNQAATPRAVKEAYDAATSAQAVAGSASAAAGAATTTANNASALATSASTNAAQALVCATNAQLDATQALTNAAAAQTTANTALATANTANTTANTALAVANGSIQRTAFSAPGQLLVGTGASLFSALSPGPNGFVLTAFSGSPTGLTWCPATSSGTVTSVAAGTGLCGGPITSSGTLCLTDTGVLPGVYNNASFTVDAQGRISLASSNPTPLTAISASSPLSVTAGAVPVITVCNASLGSAGVVQLYNATNSPSTTLALTAAQGKNLQDQINALGATSNLTLAGTFDASTSQMVTVTADGLTKGFVVNSNIPFAASGNADYFVIVTTGGSYNPPGGGGPYNTSQGDWLLSNGASWQFLNVGASVPYATTLSPGSVCLSTPSLAIAGTDSTTAITPSVGRAAYVFNCDYTGKGAIVAGTGVGTTGALPLGPNGTVLTACPACPTGLTWTAAGAPAIPCACITGKGDIVTGTGIGLPAALPVGANDLILTADSTTSTGLAWAANTAIPCSVITNKGDIVIGSGANSPTALPPGLDNYVLTADSACANGLKWAVAAVTGVTCVCTGTGLCGGPIDSVGTISLEDTAVTPGTYTNATITVDAQGRLTFADDGTPGTVTCVCTGVGLTGGPIVSTGEIALADTSVTPGNYTYATICVDQQGRLTCAETGTAPNTTVALPITNTGTAVEPIIGIQTATTGQLGAVQVGANIDVAAGVISVATSSTTVPGIVQLNDTVASTSVTEALTAAQGKVLQDQINTLSVTTNLTLAGTFDAAASQMLTVTSSGSSAGFTIGANLPASAPALTDFFVIVTTGGSYSPPGGGGPYPANQGDWFLNNGTSWQYLNVGTDLPVASTGTQGIVQLATPTETATGTSTSLAITPAGACATYIPYTALTAKGAILTASGANTLVTLPLGSDGQVLTACPAAPSGLCWAPASTPSIPCACLVAKGSLVTATAASTPVNLAVGSDGQILTACSTSTNGLCWTANTAIPCACITAKGTIVTGTGASTPTALPVGSNGQILSANSSCASGLEWVAGSFIPCCCITGKGALVTGTAASTPTALAVGADGKYLIACAACPSGLTWGDGCSIVNLHPVIRNANYTFTIPSPNFTPKVICYNEVICDSTGWYNGTTGVFQPTVPGYYQISALGRVYANNSCSAEAALGLVCNGTLIGSQGSFGAVNSTVSTLVYMNGSTDALCVVAIIQASSGTNVLSVGNSRFTALLAQAQVAPTQICGDTPVGAINWFGSTTAPSGWLVADGRQVSRTGYADLFAVVGTTYGAGDGSTTFNLPDLRGQFLRGWDAAGGNARGCDPGRTFGSSQGFALQNHCHNVEVIGGAAGRPEWACPNNACPAGASFPNSSGGGAIRTAGFTSTVGSTETRPTNVALLPCIKWATTIAPPTPSACGIPCSTLVSKGSLITTASANIPVALPVGNDGQVLVANSACSSGLQWRTGALGPWISAGTIQSVGWNSTGGVAVVPGTTSVNNVSYRQLGQNEWEVVYSFTATGNFTNGGSGTYLFTLPNGLQFDTTLPWQRVISAASPGSNHGWRSYFIPGASSMQVAFSNGSNGSQFGTGVVPYDATRFRIFATDVGNGGPQPMANNYWGNTNILTFTVGFQFTTP